jgi:hypothetical protein
VAVASTLFPPSVVAVASALLPSSEGGVAPTPPLELGTAVAAGVLAPPVKTLHASEETRSATKARSQRFLFIRISFLFVEWIKNYSMGIAVMDIKNT